MKKIYLIAFLVFQSLLFSQNKKNDSLPTILELLKYDGVSTFNGLTTTYTKPLKWKKNNFLTAGIIIIGTGALYLIDEESNIWFENQEKDIPGIIKDFGWYYGSPQNNYAINGVVYLYGLITKNQKIRKTGVLLISAASTAGLIQTISKITVGRGRPGAGEGKGSVKSFSKEDGFHSFPSGHTILSFTTAYAIRKQFKSIAKSNN